MDADISDAQGPGRANPLDRVYRSAESFDVETIRGCLRLDAFLFTPEADGVLDSAAGVAADLRRRFDSLRDRGATVRIRAGASLVGTNESGDGCWVFDQIVVEVLEQGTPVQTVPVRVTALLSRDDGGWRIAAGFWSVAYETQEAQDSVKHAGLLAPGEVLEEAIWDTARQLAERLRTALSQPRLLPELYSTQEAAVTIGSVSDEVFVGPNGRAAWQEFVQYVDAFTPRGPMRAALVTPDLGWLAANIDVGEPPTPYRFFYIWHREGQDWRIVVSHDAVSRDLA